MNDLALTLLVTGWMTVTMTLAVLQNRSLRKRRQERSWRMRLERRLQDLRDQRL